ncbi:uncharacterized protein [Physcomitrium patens]|uniref:uncharacterized protein isoform X2 n=1 Tax=Physcomitrium patens TaxID=3218 RepID=UPI003CCDC72F
MLKCFQDTNATSEMKRDNMISSKAGQRTNLLKVNLVVVLISFNTLKITAVEFLFGGTVQEENPMVPNTLTDQTRERISNP